MRGPTPNKQRRNVLVDDDDSDDTDNEVFKIVGDDESSDDNDDGESQSESGYVKKQLSAFGGPKKASNWFR